MLAISKRIGCHGFFGKVDNPAIQIITLWQISRPDCFWHFYGTVKTVLPACLGKIVASTCWWSSSTVPLLGANSPNITVWCLGKLLPGQLLREGFGNSSGWRPAKGGLRCHLKKVLVCCFLKMFFLMLLPSPHLSPLENWGRWLMTDEHDFLYNWGGESPPL